MINEAVKFNDEDHASFKKMIEKNKIESQVANYKNTALN